MAIGYQSCGLMLESPVVNNYLCMSSHLSMSFIFLMFDQIYSRNLSYLEILKLKFLRQEGGLLLIWGHHRLHSKFRDSVGYKMEPSLKCMYTYMHTNTHAYINAKYFFFILNSQLDLLFYIIFKLALCNHYPLWDLFLLWRLCVLSILHCPCGLPH